MSEFALRNAIRRAPNNANAHADLALHFLQTGRQAEAVDHLWLAYTFSPSPRRLAQLAHAELAAGHLKEAVTHARKASDNYPEALPLLAEALMSSRDYAEARIVVARAQETLPGRDLAELLAKLSLRMGGSPQTILPLLANAATPSAIMLRGQIYEKLGEYDLAWSDFTAANKAYGRPYDEARAADLHARIVKFWRRFDLERYERDENPIFVCGYPRSGTTLTEQILSAHDNVTAGDELPFCHNLMLNLPRLIPSPLPYPECLADAIFADRRDIARRAGEEYLRLARGRGITTWRRFTDKMPLNEMHAPLIAAMFPDAPIIRVVRDPRDVLVSNFGNLLSHGLDQSTDIMTCARHMVRHFETVEAIRHKAPRYFEFRYEWLIKDQVGATRALLEAADLKWDDTCLRPEENTRAPRTPSAAAVAKPVNDAAKGRWRHYEKHLGAALDALRPLLDRLAY